MLEMFVCSLIMLVVNLVISFATYYAKKKNVCILFHEINNFLGNILGHFNS